MTIKKTNHLGSRLDKLAEAKLALPNDLMTRYYKLQDLTAIAQHNLHDLLDNHLLGDSLLQSCQVVDFDRTSVTLCVSNQTYANHLTHLSDHIVSRLLGVCDEFAHLRTVRVIALQ